MRAGRFVQHARPVDHANIARLCFRCDGCLFDLLIKRLIELRTRVRFLLKSVELGQHGHLLAGALHLRLHQMLARLCRRVARLHIPENLCTLRVQLRLQFVRLILKLLGVRVACPIDRASL